MSVERREHTPGRRLVQPDRLAKRTAESLAVQARRQVDQHPGSRCDRDPLVAGDLAAEHLRVKHEHATLPTAAALPGSRHHLVAALEAVKAVARAGAAVA